MRVWLINLWDSYRTSLWFIPSLLIGLAAVLGFGLPEVDSSISSDLPDWLKTSGSTARSMLGALTSAMFATAGIVFSATAVTLSITASQLGPRLLRSFMGQPIAQLTVGCCLATCVFSILLMRKVDDYDGDVFVPHLSVIVATAMALGTLCVVVYFIHYVAQSIQPSNVVATVAKELEQTIERLFPERIGKGEGKNDKARSLSDQEIKSFLNGEPVRATGVGYVVAVDGAGLLKAASASNAAIYLNVRPGDFVARDAAIAFIKQGDEETKKPNGLNQTVAKSILLENRRTPRQDVECAVNDLVEIAVRALSPGINDPFTALVCVDRLGAAVAHLAQRGVPSPLRFDDDEQLRVVARPYTFHSVINAAFDQIRQYGATSAAVSARLMEALLLVAKSTDRREDQDDVMRQADMIVDAARKSLITPGDVADVEGRHQEIVKAIGR
jgi:uncharacterized membrane protein